MNELSNNLASFIGTVASGLDYEYAWFGEAFYKTYLRIERISGVEDILPVIVSERLIMTEESLVGKKVLVNGSIRSFNRRSDGKSKSKLQLFIFADELEVLDESEYKDGNNVILTGFLCKEPVYRVTPYGREITDVFIAVNRRCGKSDYIPCICWGRAAKYVSTLGIGDLVTVRGRMQSRTYTKKTEEGVVEHIAYEVSLSTVSLEKEA